MRRFTGKQARKPAEAPLYFSQIKNLSDDEWRAALNESPETAARWVEAAATYGNVDAQLYWAQMLLEGHGTARDPDRAFRWFCAAAESGRADAVNMVGRCHERGWGTPQDCEKAAACYRDAAAQSYDWAQFNLASLMIDGRGIARDPESAFDLFAKAAAQGHVKSFHMVGRFFETGLGRPKDLDEAERWYRRGAEGDDFRAQHRYGVLLAERGRADEALPWLTRVVETAPEGFRRDIHDSLCGHPHPLLRDMGARIGASLGASGTGG